MPERCNPEDDTLVDYVEDRLGGFNYDEVVRYIGSNANFNGSVGRIVGFMTHHSGKPAVFVDFDDDGSVLTFCENIQHVEEDT